MKNIFKSKQEIKQHKFDDLNAIEARELKFKYHGAKRGQWHLNDVSIDIKNGDWTTILGPNGSGKSTLAKAIVRINKLKKGLITIDGKDIHDYKGKEFAKRVAYIPQVLDVPHGTSVFDFVSFGRNPYLGVTGSLSHKDKKIIKDAMQETGTWEWSKKMMDELSGGQRQKVLIAMVIAQDADIILLDEPTTYLDIRNQYELLEMMHYEHIRGKTIITILHDINQAVQYSDHIYVLKEGKVYAKGTPEKVINQKMLKDVYGVDAKLYSDKKRKYITDVKLVDFAYGVGKLHKHVDGKVHKHKLGKHEHEHDHEIKSEVKVKR